MIQVSKAEAADRYTILLLKKQANLPVEQELKRYEGEIEGLDSGLLDTLLHTNREIWDIEDRMRRLEEREPIPVEEAGWMYVRMRRLNKTRVAIKNTIAASFKEFQDPRTQYVDTGHLKP